jgi:hypothetical protein
LPPGLLCAIGASPPARCKNREALNAELGKLTEKKFFETWVAEL